MGYTTFKESPKQLSTAESIGDGQIQLRHLAPSLYSEIQRISLHTHTGVKSSRIHLKDLFGYFPVGGFYMYSSDGTKKYKVTINSATGAFVLTDVT